MNHSVDIDLPVRTVYDQWTQFEDFPLFMKHVKDVRQVDDTTLEWTVSIYGIKRSWTAEITEQTPDQRVAWTAVDGTKNAGVVTFHALSDDRTRVMLQMEMDPDGFLESVADWGGYMSDRSRKDLEQFKDFIENRGRATGAWRGEVERDSARDLHHHEEELRQLSDADLARRAEAAGIERPLDRPREWIVSAVAHQERGDDRYGTQHDEGDERTHDWGRDEADGRHLRTDEDAERDRDIDVRDRDEARR
ncbi:SRPBCC family protein [Actinomarinicola tropica]|uniref:Coenzyme Q-binding protein COQ10 START domain-containing protein n=1 Tax=Actinomarinicola tropica TaxID=2789776 RepID=A0A5Q2RKL7_9ACTN|nr:SRPBCC family protein [Actinomarinicola tropica]QGG96373.1 hypothetical protein GH723_15405 [Actinomarinicola tropica]